MRRTSQFVALIALVWFVASGIMDAASTAINFATQLTGIGLVANGMTAAATTSGGFSLAGPASGSAAAYSFKAFPFSQFSGFALLSQGIEASCTPSGSSVTCIGDVADSGGTDSVATTTLPTYTTALSDTTGAGCGTQLVGNQSFWFGSTRNQRAYARVRFSSTTGIRARWSLVNGGILFCGTQTSIANAMVAIRSSSTTPDTNFVGEATDAVGTNVTTCDTGVPVDANFHLMSMEYDSALGRVNYYVDNMTTPGCFQSTNIPTGVVVGNLFGAYCNTCGAVQKFTDYAFYQISQPPY